MMGKCTSKIWKSSDIEGIVIAAFVQNCLVSEREKGNSSLDIIISSKLLVKNVDGDTTKEELHEFFQTFGTVSSLKRTRMWKTVFVTFTKGVDWGTVYHMYPEALVFGRYYLNLNPNDMDAVSTDSLDIRNDSRTTIHTLPNEIMDHIFSFLTIKERIRTERVCRRWRDIGIYLQWRWPTSIDLGDIEAFWEDDSLLLTDDIVSSILSRCGRGVKKLELSTKAAHSQLVTRKSIVTIGKYCPNLNEIGLDDLPEIETSDIKLYLEPLARGCPKLRHVTILNTSFTDECLSSYFKLCQVTSASESWVLETFGLVRNDMVVGKCFGDISKNLRGLRLFGCYRIKPEVAFVALMSRCQSIQELTIRYCCETLKPDLLSKMLSYYKHTIKVLRLDGHGFKPAVWSESLGHLHVAEKVSLEKCRGVNDEVLQTMAGKCVNLYVLNVSGTCVTDEGITALAKHCVNLRALNVCETQITDEGVSALAIECMHLRALNVSFTSITDVGVSVLASALHLKVLDISYTSEVTGAGINDLAEKGQLEELYVRAITRNDNVVQESCIALSKFCPNFRVLDIRATKNINSTLVEQFSSAIQKGFLRETVYLYVGLTAVKRDPAHKKGKLKVSFDTTFRTDFFNKVYFSGN